MRGVLPRMVTKPPSSEPSEQAAADMDDGLNVTRVCELLLDIFHTDTGGFEIDRNDRAAYEEVADVYRIGVLGRRPIKVLFRPVAHVWRLADAQTW